MAPTVTNIDVRHSTFYINALGIRFRKSLKASGTKGIGMVKLGKYNVSINTGLAVMKGKILTNTHAIGRVT